MGFTDGVRCSKLPAGHAVMGTNHQFESDKKVGAHFQMDSFETEIAVGYIASGMENRKTRGSECHLKYRFPLGNTYSRSFSLRLAAARQRIMYKRSERARRRASEQTNTPNRSRHEQKNAGTAAAAAWEKPTNEQ